MYLFTHDSRRVSQRMCVTAVPATTLPPTARASEGLQFSQKARDRQTLSGLASGH